jgi:hypothetical protein
MAESSHRGGLALQKTIVPGCTVFPLATTLALSVTGLPTRIEAEGNRVNDVDVGVAAFATEANKGLK